MSMKYGVCFYQLFVKIKWLAWDKDKKYLDKNILGFECSYSMIK